MSKSVSPVSLGQDVFVIVAGSIFHTLVGKLEADGDYIFLNGLHSSVPHWFDLKEALAHLDKDLKEKQKNLRRQVRKLLELRKAVASDTYLASVMTAPLRVITIHEESPRRSSLRKRVTCPIHYLRPGTAVYVAVTPWTELRYSGLMVYRPCEYFVLETLVKSVYFTPDGKVYYTYTTPFQVDVVFETEKEAEAELLQNHKFDKSRPVRFIPHTEEKEVLDQMREEEGPPF